MVGLPPHTLMRRAGQAVARIALAVEPHARSIWIACGPGNNGGDGLEAAARLQEAGKRVQVTWLGALSGAAPIPGDAQDALARAVAAGVRISPELPNPSESHDLRIDALLGIGARRAPADRLAQCIARLNADLATVLSVDIPSGLSPDTGTWLGDVCVRADHTLSLLTLKPGLFTASGRDQSGEIWLDRLSLDLDQDADADAWLSGAAEAAPPRRHAQHKGSFGDLWVVGGAPGMTGAALLAGRAAAASGAGRTFVALLGDRKGEPFGIDPLHPELMFRCGDAVAPDTWRESTVVCGCGGGDAVRARLPALLGAAGRLVLDADALNALATDAQLMTLLRHRAQRSQATVLTPHPLEAARLLGCDVATVQSDRLAAAAELTARTRCVVVLKGSGSVVAAPGRTPHINATGNASLATGGTGDVLAGWLGGRWSQCGRPGPQPERELDQAFETASQAAADHGRAAEPMRPGALSASELIGRLGECLRSASEAAGKI